MTPTIKIAHLYASYLNIYGDIGNILTLKYRSLSRQINCEISKVDSCKDLNKQDFDIFFIGGGQDKQQEFIAKDLYKYKNELLARIDDNCVVLAICGGYQLLGHYYKPHIGDKLPGISAIDAYTVASNTRMIGNVVVTLPDNSTLVGFENHSGKTFLGDSIKAIGKVPLKSGNNGEDGFEGAHYKNVFGTYLHGSLLPKNPKFADTIIKLALERKNQNFDLFQLDDNIENKAHEYIVMHRRKK